jgi:cytochrome c553
LGDTFTGCRRQPVSLQGQHGAYIERQLAAFAQGMRQNDINEQMRAIATQLTPEEMHAVAAYYGAQGTARMTEVSSWGMPFPPVPLGRQRSVQ